VGLVLGLATAGYGLIALWTGRTFLPGIKGQTSTVTGSHGAAMAAAYVSGGLYLFLRFFLHKRCRSEWARAQVYLMENALLIVLIAVLAYVLWQVGTVG
jgi:hypothetical protein